MPAGTYQILDLGVTLASEDDSFLRAFQEDYACFETQGPLHGRTLNVRFEPAGPGRDPFLELEGDRRSLEGHPFPAQYALFVLHRALMEAVRAYTVLHGAVLADAGRALVLCGPSGSGKTTLALDLLEEGLTFLSDDFCPVSHGTGLVHPFPRSLWVRDEAGAGVVRPLLEAEGGHRGKRRLAAGGSAFPTGDRPCPMGWLICLASGGDGGGREVLQVGLRSRGREAFLEEVGALPGVVITKPGGPRSHEWQVHYTRDAGLTERLLEQLERHREAIWNTSTVPVRGPDFDREPELEPIPSHQAAFLLLRERKQRGLAPAAKGGPLLMHLNELLAEVRCYRLTPGHRRARLGLVLALLGKDGAA